VGFTVRAGCVPLNGCGSAAIYPFLYSFCTFVTVVALNLFVGVILSGFAQVGRGFLFPRPTLSFFF
jgi:type III secretory pathway component EscU